MIWFVTGDKDAGKSTFTHSLADALSNRDLRVGGFLSLGKAASDHRKSFELFDLTSRQKWPLAEPEMRPGYLACGRYYFNPMTLKLGETILYDALQSRSELIVLDEIGHCELEGMIWDTVLRNMLASSCNLIIVAARKNLEKIISLFAIKGYTIIDVSRTTIDDATIILTKHLDNH